MSRLPFHGAPPQRRADYPNFGRGRGDHGLQQGMPRHVMESNYKPAVLDRYYDTHPQPFGWSISLSSLNLTFDETQWANASDHSQTINDKYDLGNPSFLGAQRFRVSREAWTWNKNLWIAPIDADSITVGVDGFGVPIGSTATTTATITVTLLDANGVVISGVDLSTMLTVDAKAIFTTTFLREVSGVFPYPSINITKTIAAVYTMPSNLLDFNAIRLQKTLAEAGGPVFSNFNSSIVANMWFWENEYDHVAG